MEKEEILEKSRKENKNRDIFEKEVLKEGGNIGGIAAGILATLFFILQIAAGGGINYGLYAGIFYPFGRLYRESRPHEAQARNRNVGVLYRFCSCTLRSPYL